MPKIELERYFTPQLALARLQRLPPATKTPIIELVYPTGKQDTYPKSRLAVMDLPSAVKNLPVISRGSAAFAVPKESKKIDGYEPFPVEVTDSISDAQLNDLQNLTDEDINSYIDLKVQRLKEGCKATAEALALQSLSGAISYSMQVAPGSFEYYTANFGDTKTFAPQKLWSDPATGIEDIIEDQNSIGEKLAEDGFDANVSVLCGTLAFKALVRIANAAAAKGIKIEIDQNEIKMPGFSFRRFAGQYYNYKTKAFVKGVDPKKVVALGLDAPFWLPYCSLDNADAGFKPLPFWSSVRRDPQTQKGYIISGESKPFPVPIVKALVWGTVHA